MAADDDKISSNRRRLFKALSAAPIVATLRPGEALANNSAFQCAAKVRELTIDQFIPEGLIPSGSNCEDAAVGAECTVQGVIYRKVLYWQKLQVKDAVDLLPDTDPCKQVWADLPDRIVQLDDDLIKLDFTVQGMVTPVTNVEIGSTVNGRVRLNVYDGTPSSTAKLCFFLSSLKGLVAYIGRTSNMDMEWQGDGFFPEYAAQNGVIQPGSYQGMTDSCMHSFMGELFGMNP